MQLQSPSFVNSPKKQVLQELTVLFASYQIDKVKAWFADDITWTLVGDSPIQGKEAFADALAAMSPNKATRLTIHSMLTHGREAAVHGEMQMEDGKRFGFADFYTFTSAGSSRIHAITSYVIELPVES